jgi:sulfatase maturation enzyme AslB (radical SAM superfamily)
LKEGSFINFYGGEPLLAFPQIQHAVQLLQNGRETQFSLSTNGSLIDDEKLEFFNQNKFSILLSFDGIVQDITRQNASLKKTLAVLEKILACPDIDLEIHSVFTPETIPYISESALLMTKLGVPEFSIVLSQTDEWDLSALLSYKEELQFLKPFMLAFYLREGYIPFANFRRNKSRGVFSCYAGRDRLTIMPDGKIWGCHLFADFYNGKEDSEEYSKYCFGDLDSFMENCESIYPEISSNYLDFRMDRFYTDDTRCVDCEEIEECRVCPLDNRINGSHLNEIPRWVCEQNKILRDVRKDFWKALIPE